MIEATPNHPMLTSENVKKKMGDILIGESVICSNSITKNFEHYQVINKIERAAGVQKVYNMELDQGTTAVLNEVMVLQK